MRFTMVSAQTFDSIAVHIEVDSLVKTAQAFMEQQAFDKSFETLDRAEKIALDRFGRVSAEYAECLNMRGFTFFMMYDFSNAEKWMLQTMEIRAKVFQTTDPSYCGSLINLGGVYQAMGQYEKAEYYYLKAKTIYETHLKDKLDLWYANCVSNLAGLYTLLGDFEKSERTYLNILEFRSRSWKKGTDYASDLGSLAYVYRLMGQYDKADSLIHEALRILETTVGKDHDKYAKYLSGLGQLYDIKRDYQKAELLLQEACQVSKRAVGKELPDNFQDLAELYEHQGLYRKAEQMYLKAIQLYERNYSKEEPDYANLLFELSRMYFNMARYVEAEPICKELLTLSQKFLTHSQHHLSEREMGKYVNLFKEYQNLAYSLLHQRYSTGLGEICYDNILFFKGFLLNAVNQVKRVVLSDSNSIEKYNLLKTYGRALAVEYSYPYAERDSAKVVELEEKSNMLEKELARYVSEYGGAVRQVYWKEVQARLKPGEAAVEFIDYPFQDRNASDSTMYSAFILTSGNSSPSFIPLFEKRTLDSIFGTRIERKADYVNALYTLSDRGAVAVESPRRSLYDVLWKPLEKELIGVKTIYFSPSGLLHRINLDAIPVTESETLADRYHLIELNSTRQLVVPGQIKQENNDAVLYGGIQFELDSSFQYNEPLMAARSRGELTFRSIDSTLRGGSWNYLAGTEREVNAIEKIMQTYGVQTQLKKGYEATEESFKNMGTNNSASPRILHIATHGYFFPDPKNKKETLMNSEPVFKISDHPMLRSGLIMAGGNAAWQGKQTLEGREDGVLTAYEISQMNLSNTELVILSACETGLGDIQGNEGVYGLQRAFKIAGVKYIIMSLWQVPDKQTSLLMTTFYKKWLENKMTIPDAFHAAQKELRDIGLDPYNWAGFVLVE